MSRISYLSVAPERKRRVFILTDAKNEADDQYAIAHALLSPSLEVEGVVASHFVRPHTMELSYEEARKVVSLAGAERKVLVLRGHDGSLTAKNESAGDELSEGARYLIERANADTEAPLFVLCLGPLTEMAEALRAAPEIAERICLVWVGGASYPEGGREANLMHDVIAAQEVFDSSIDLWQITQRAYSRMLVPVSKLYAEVRPAGDLGSYLYRELTEFSETNMAAKPWIQPEYWSLGDNTAVGLMLCRQEYHAVCQERPRIGDDGRYLLRDSELPSVKVYESIDAQPIMEDMFYKIGHFADVATA